MNEQTHGPPFKPEQIAPSGRRPDQRYQTFSDTGVVALTESAISLGPGWYSLSSQSTIPYVSLIGAQGYNKILSWGEIIEVPRGMNVTVKSESFHTGDIFINSGRDFATKPDRVTVPVEILLPNNNPAFICDVRRARRAYLVVDLLSAATLVTVTVTGAIKVHSHTAPSLFTPGTGYRFTRTYPANTQICYIPLGFCAAGDEVRPMALLDTATLIFVAIGAGVLGTTAYYVLEY